MTNEEIRASLLPLPPDADPGFYSAIMMEGVSLLVRDTPTHVVTVFRLTFGRARIAVARGGDFIGYDDNW